MRPNLQEGLFWTGVFFRTLVLIAAAAYLFGVFGMQPATVGVAEEIVGNG
jgi:hypothetical protein